MNYESLVPESLNVSYLTQVRELTQQNLNPYIGSCVEVPDNFFLASVYFRKGSLQDVLSDSNLKLDDMFKMSFIFDICKVCFLFKISCSHLFYNLFSRGSII